MTRGVFRLEEVLKLQQKIVPEMIQLLEKRYGILRNIYYNQPIGRRMLSKNLELSERIVRTEINFLRENGFIEITTPGMSITDEGEVLVEKLKGFIRELKGLSKLEYLLKEKLLLKDVVIVQGNMDEDQTVINELGKVAANYLKGMIKSNDVIALTGGSTVKTMVDSVQKCNGFNEVTIVPARGGIGRNLETQANTLVSKLANKFSCNYRLFHVPDNLGCEAIKAMMKEKDIIEVMNIIDNTNILVYGIGRADEMAKRRGLSSDQIENLRIQGALGEALGHYFNKSGEVVYYTPTMGIKSKQVKNTRDVIAIAGGSAKAEAIIATEINNLNGILITDEGAARKILEILSSE